MALGMLFKPKGMTAAAYDDVIRRLEEAGAGHPPGRMSHASVIVDGDVWVFDIWESREQFEKFGATLIPILRAAGVDPDEPIVGEVHNTIAG
ncbi:MAG TPA: hypothetical protein VKT77_16660 [Chthonomonadaceae bacterium]|nr:hypothetical protein [Chthonomonadaceae bacterium]